MSEGFCLEMTPVRRGITLIKYWMEKNVKPEFSPQSKCFQKEYKIISQSKTDWIYCKQTFIKDW